MVRRTEESPVSEIEPRVLPCPVRSLAAIRDEVFVLFFFLVHKFCMLSEQISVSV